MEGAKKTKVERYIVLALLGVFALTLPGTLRSIGLLRPRAPRGVVPMTSGDSQALAPVQASPGSTRTPLTSPPRAAYTAHTLRDPLQNLLPDESKPVVQPPTPQVPDRPTGQPLAQGAPSTLDIQGLIWGGPEPKAIINDEVYGVGDVIQGATITSIEQEGITMESGGHTTVVSIGQGAGKPPSSFVPPYGRRQ